MPSHTLNNPVKERETKVQTVFNQYLRATKMVGFFELKVTNLDRLAFSKIEKHQYEGLQATAKEGLIWKLSDEDQRQKPCDCLSIPALPSYLVIKFLDGFYIIRIEKIIELRDSGLIAISKAQAEQLAEKIIKIEKK